MEKLEKIRNVVRETFRQTFIEQGAEYSLKEISNMPKINHINFIICDDFGICSEFCVSETDIFEAVLKNGLAVNKYELQVWLDFVTKVNDKLQALYFEELSSEESYD